jgi:hypothetical protein
VNLQELVRSVEELLRSGFTIRGRGSGREKTNALVDHAEIDQLIFGRVADDADGIEPLLHALDLFAQKFS